MFDDKKLKQAVIDQLNWEPGVNAAHIGVAASSGVITLTGYVESYAEKSAAEKAVQRVKNVKAVAEEIEVQLPSNVKYGDEEIASAAAHRLKWDSVLPGGAVMVTVENGIVTLTGEVDGHYQQEAAADDIRNLRGVVRLVNRIGIKPRPNATDIRDNIKGTLDRLWLGPETISVTAREGKVTLTGTVETWYSRELADSTAWAAPGVTAVENDIKVN